MKTIKMPIQGFPTEYQGRELLIDTQFVKDGLDITAGNFYEQFGSGMILKPTKNADWI